MEQLSAKQQIVFDLALTGISLDVRGKAGTGKTFIIKRVIAQLKKSGRNVICIAPTGMAANNLGGQTIHSMFGLAPHGILTFDTCNWMKGEKRRMLDAVDTIVIDEDSMLRADVLDAINWTLIKNGCAGLDKKQVIFVGDLAQLGCVLTDNTRSVLYQTYDGDDFTFAKIFSRINPTVVELDEVLRQTNEEFINNLNIIRERGRSDYFKQFVHTEPHGVILAPHTSTVNHYNKKGLAELDTEEFFFHATITGNVKADEFNLETVVHVKQGAKIMYLVNSKDNNNLINGTMGIFVSHAGCHYINVDGVDYALKEVLLSKKEYVLNEETNALEMKELGTILQLPIRLAYALSIHKSQGMTFDNVTLDLTQPCFTPGQMYVALSRVRTPDGLRIITPKK